ncbi:hypothetical protein LJC59_09250, partial [Desulfovibrio sp. OttesenSCG-928-A18]|nr:hypothetical protein [Desulfovibrio sp. OttesenSCG-928-A18]
MKRPSGAEAGTALHSPAPPPDPLYLDRHLAGRLSRHFSRPVPGHGEQLRAALGLWQWEHLARSLLHAAENSHWYKKNIGPQAARDMLTQAAPAAFLVGGAQGGTHAGEAAFIPGTDRLRLADEEREAAEGAIRALVGQLPFTRPEELAADSGAFLAVGQGDVAGLISIASSGTSGSGAKRVFCTAADLEHTVDFFRHGMQYMVWPKGRPRAGEEHVVLLMSGERPGSVGDLLLRAMRDLGVNCTVLGMLPVDPPAEERFMQRLCAIRPSCLVGIPGQVLRLSRHARAAALRGSLGSVLLSGDAVTASLRNGIARALACPVFVHYGLTETGLGGAVECSFLAGCHMREADLLFEILDARGRPVAPGQFGELVISTLTRQAMPLLRYRTGDAGRVPAGDCPCGSILGRLEVQGRMSECLPLPGGACLHITVIDAVLYALPFLRAYSAVLHTPPGRPPCLRLDITCGAGAPEDAEEHIYRALATIPGLHPVKTPAEETEEGCLRVLLRPASQGAHTEVTGEAGPRPKQSILRSELPP